MYEKNLFNQLSKELPSVFTTTSLSATEEILNNFNKFFSNLPSKSNCTYPYDMFVEFDESGEKELKWIINIAIAGIKKENCNISVDTKEYLLNILINTSDKNSINNEKNINKNIKYIHNGISMRSSKMVLALNDKVDIENIEVKFEDGILNIELPLKEEKEIENPIKVLEIK